MKLPGQGEIRAALLGAAVAALAASAGAAERLTAEGASLPGVAFPQGGPLEARVDVAGEEVIEVHTILRPASSNVALMRDRDGFWTDWSGRREDLIPAAAKREGDELVFKIFETPPAGTPAMLITIAYRTAEGLKFGTFEAAETME
ncbi:MAG: hypothetical protein AAF322_19860 [Pseudomonadota bacterium]